MSTCRMTCQTPGFSSPSLIRVTGVIKTAPLYMQTRHNLASLHEDGNRRTILQHTTTTILWSFSRWTWNCQLVPPRFSASTCSRTEHLGISGMGSLQGRCPSCHPIDSVKSLLKALTPTRVITQWPRPFWIHQWNLREVKIVKEAYMYSAQYELFISKALRYGTC